MDTVKRKWFLLVFSSIALITIAANVLALTDPEITRYHIGAGSTSSGGDFTVMGSIGQHDAGETLTGGDFSLEGGFWGVGSLGVEIKVYLPVVIR